MFISSLSYIIVSTHVMSVWCTKPDRKESIAVWETPHPYPPASAGSIIPCSVVWPRAHTPPSFSQHLIKALADFARPDIWEKETTERLPRESGWLSDTNSAAQIMNISTLNTMAFTQWSVECNLRWHPSVSCQPWQTSCFSNKKQKINLNN